MPTSIESQLRATYLTLRMGAAVIGMLFPFFLWIGGTYKGISLRPSMSAYYYATAAHPDPDCSQGEKDLPVGAMRDWFVGLLFAVGAMLAVNRGSSPKENIALSMAGVLVAAVAVTPTEWACDHKFTYHDFFAISFFLAIAFVCVFCARETLQHITDPKVVRIFRTLYVIMASCMVISPIAAWFLRFGPTTRMLGTTPLKDHHVFCAEAAGVITFGVFWAIKSIEIAYIIRHMKPAFADGVHGGAPLIV